MSLIASASSPTTGAFRVGISIAPDRTDGNREFAESIKLFWSSIFLKKHIKKKDRLRYPAMPLGWTLIATRLAGQSLVYVTLIIQCFPLSLILL